MRESGVITRVIKRWYADAEKVRQRCAKAQQDGSEEGDGGGGTGADGYGLDRVGIFFMVVLAGVVASCLTFLVEKVARGRSQDEKYRHS